LPLTPSSEQAAQVQESPFYKIVGFVYIDALPTTANCGYAPERAFDFCPQNHLISLNRLLTGIFDLGEADLLTFTRGNKERNDEP
jgi:hypothetical protein